MMRHDPLTGYIGTSSPLLIPPEGRIFGHEAIGRVIATGSEVRNFEPGSVVALESMICCGHCDCCLRNLPNQCRKARLIGMEQDGYFATIADVPASVAYDVTALVHTDRDLQGLACLEPAGVALVACRSGRVAAGDRVVVFGGGPIGLYCAMLARTAFSAGEIHLVEPEPFRREFAARWVGHVHAPEEFFASPLERIDVAIEASSFMENASRVLPRMNAGGRIVLLARSNKPLVLATTDPMITNAVSITGSRGHLGAFPELLQLYRDGLFNPGEIVTRAVHGLQELAELLRDPEKITRQECKVLVRLGKGTGS
jgi:threonine dehydrogenase-like Zn-dependent dehydrogenase